MDPFVLAKALVICAVFAVAALLVLRANPPGSPARKKRPFAIWHLMAFTAVTAMCFGAGKGFNSGAMIPAVITVVLFLLAINPYPLFWQSLEMAAMAAWFTATALAYSDVQANFGTFIVLLMIGPVICFSWILRSCLRWQRPSSRSDWASLLHFPLAIVLLVVLLWTRLPLNLRLALSEPALRACVSQLPPGNATYSYAEERRVGLIWARQIEVREHCVLWTTGSFFMSAHGLAYIPSDAPPALDGHQFERIRGPWWSFQN
jgi:hypothetical protein